MQLNRGLHTDRGIKKTRQSFQLQRHIEVPTFAGHDGAIAQTPYGLCGGVLHIGKVVTAGHYQAFYFRGEDNEIWPLHLVHDDGHAAVSGTDVTRQAILTNCYLLAYRKRGHV